jgi:hypothetical protein
MIIQQQRTMKEFFHLICAALWMFGLAHGEDKAPKPKPAPIPAYNPARQPVATGEVPVGLIVIAFTETAMPGDFSHGMAALGKIKGISQEEYFKIYSNGIAWPKILVMPYDGIIYKAPKFYGYYCEYDYWKNPLGWKTREDGDNRGNRLKKDALQFASKQYRGTKARFICYNYITTRPEQADKAVTDELGGYYKGPRDNSASDKNKYRKPRKNDKPGQVNPNFDPWDYYAPGCRWGDPLWPDSTIQIHDFSSDTFAHELGHSLGAPDVYHLGRYNDGIANNASLLAYGPTANAFSRFYHHTYIKEKNHPTIKSSGTYTLYPRHLDPQGGEVLGYIIPSSHPHYYYHVEYIHGENNTVGVGTDKEGMLISVVNLGLTSFLGSPDYFYVYRPNDPFFRGLGDTKDCLFGKRHKRTEFNMTTEPSCRLPNLMDGGVSFKNIQESNGTLTFDVVIAHKTISGAAYTNSMRPQIRLEEILDIQATSFTMNCTIKFRGEPLKTAYGFCWSSKSNPTVKDDTYVLAHRECYSGHAINLKPATTYYVRAFATNGLGVRYSDEEKTVKTLDPKTPPASIGPLCTDGFSNNDYLHAHYSNEGAGSSRSSIGYSPTCVLAKLIAYHRPAKCTIGSPDKKHKEAVVNFDNLSWNPGWDDFPKRLEEVRNFFGAIYSQSQQLGFHAPIIEKDFIRNLVKLTGVESKPVVSMFATGNLQEATDLIHNDLRQSRPVMILFAYNAPGSPFPMRWAMIDGINSKGEFHVDFPRNTILSTAQGDMPLKSGYFKPASLLFSFYKVHIVTSLYYNPS